MSEPEYMTGEELYEKWRAGSVGFVVWKNSYVKDKWDALAAELKIPKPKKPKTIGKGVAQ